MQADRGLWLDPMPRLWERGGVLVARDTKTETRR